MIRVEVIDDARTFAQLRHEWNALLADSTSDTIFLSWEWMYTWWSYRAADRTLHLITVRDGEQLIAIAPLTLRPQRLKRLIPFRVLEFLGSDNVGSDYLSFILRSGHEKAGLDGIAQALGEARHMLELVRIDKTSMIMMSAAMRLNEDGWRTSAETTNFCPYIKLAGLTIEDYDQRIHSRHQADLKVKFRRAHRDFEVSLEVANSEAERREAMRRFVALHRARWEGRGGTTALSDRQLIAFHEAFSQLCLERGWLKLMTLRLDGDPAALLYMFYYNGVYYYYQTALNDAYQRYSAGVLITKLAIDDAIANGALEFDFLHDDEEYKYLWANRERELVRLDVLPPAAVRPLHGPVMHARESVRKLRKQFLPHHES